jgi:hypothetical protein
MKNILKSVLALAVVLFLAIPASAQVPFTDSVAVTSTNSVVTFSPANPAEILISNDGTAPIFVALNHVATAADGANRYVLNQCESLTFVSGGGLNTLGLITAASTTSTARVIATFQRPNNASLLLKGQDVGEQFRITQNSSCNPFALLTANGAQLVPFVNSELITLSTSGTTTNSVANLLPANSIIFAVPCRVTTTITTATDWSVGDSTTAARFNVAVSTLTAGTTSAGLSAMFGVVSTTATGPTQAAATTLRITTTGTPGAGAIRCSVFGVTVVPPTS